MDLWIKGFFGPGASQRCRSGLGTRARLSHSPAWHCPPLSPPAATKRTGEGAAAWKRKVDSNSFIQQTQLEVEQKHSFNYLSNH